MSSGTFSGAGTILGGLPVYAFIDHGQDGFTGEYYSEIRSIHWLCKGDKPGKEIPQHIRDRAYKYDPYFSNLMDMVNDWTVYNRQPSAVDDLKLQVAIMFGVPSRLL